MLKRLSAKQKEPDAPAVGRSMSFTIDLANDSAVKRAQKLGLLPSDDDDETETGETGETEEEVEPDDTPRRKGGGDGYFPS